MRITLWWWMYLWIPPILMWFNISTPDFRIWQHFFSILDHTPLQKLANVPEFPVIQLYKHMINTSEPVPSFTIKDDDKDPSLIWTILMHPWTYIGTIGLIFTVCIGVYCFKRFWLRPATLKCWLLFPSLIMTCYSGWLCWGSTHLQKQRHGWRTQKTPQESWPAHWTGGYKAGELL